MQTKLIEGEPILVLNESYYPVPSGVLTSVPPILLSSKIECFRCPLRGKRS